MFNGPVPTSSEQRGKKHFYAKRKKEKEAQNGDAQA